MSAYRHTFRLECDSARVGDAIDQTTGAAMTPKRGETIEFAIALLSSGVLIPKSNISSITANIVSAAGTVLATWTNSGTNLNDSLTIGAWRRGSDYMTAFVLSAADSLALTAARYTFQVSAVLNSVPSGSTGTVVFANAAFDLAAAPAGSAPASPPTPGPPTAYTKAESDARYAFIADVAAIPTLTSDVTDLQGFVDIDASTPKFVRAGVAQTLSTGEKLQARTNIGGEIAAASVSASLAAAATHTPTPAVYRRFVITLTGAATIANAATFGDWVPGLIYEILIIQDATGGRVLTWGNLYTFPTYAAVNPEPSSTSRFFARSDGTNVRVWEAEPVALPAPDMLVHAARSTTINGTPVFSTWYEFVNRLTGAATGTLAATNLSGRPALSCTGGQDVHFTGPRVGFATAGCTVAGVFDSSSSASPQFIAKMPMIGVEVAYNSANGLYIAAIGASSGNRVALAFTPATSTRTIFIGTIRASGSGGGMALNNAGGIVYNSAGSMATPALGTEYFGSNAAADFWNGKLNQVMAFTRALSWAEMLAVRRALSAEIGI